MSTSIDLSATASISNLIVKGVFDCDDIEKQETLLTKADVDSAVSIIEALLGSPGSVINSETIKSAQNSDTYVYCLSVVRGKKLKISKKKILPTENTGMSRMPSFFSSFGFCL